MHKPKRLELSALVFVLAAVAFVSTELICRQRMPEWKPPIIDESQLQFHRSVSGPLFHIETISGLDYYVQTSTTLPGRNERQKFLVNKPASVRRILVLGESSGLNLGRTLRSIVQKLKLDDKIEIMNCGVGGVSLEQMQKISREVLSCSPDAIVVMFGHNLFYDYPSLTPWGYKTGRLLRKSRAINCVVGLMGNFIDHSPQARWKKLDAFLKMVSSKARTGNVPAVFCTLPSNLWIVPKNDLYSEQFLGSLYLKYTGHRSQAVAALENMARSNPVPVWNFWLADWLYQQKDYMGAYRYLQIAKDCDTQNWRASTSVNTIIRLSVEQPNVSLLDVEQMMALSSPHGITGWESMWDNQHMRSRGFDICAFECLKLLGYAKEVDRASPRIFAGEDEFLMTAKKAMEIFDVSYNNSSIVYWALCERKRFMGGGENEIDTVDVDSRTKAGLFWAFAEAFWREGDKAEAFRLNKKAMALFPAWEQPSVQAGIFCLGIGEKRRALSEFGTALQLNPKREDVRFFINKIRTELAGPSV